MFLNAPWKFYTLSLFIPASVTRLGDFWKFLVKKIDIKVAQIFGNYVAYFEECNFLRKVCFNYF